MSVPIEGQISPSGVIRPEGVMPPANVKRLLTKGPLRPERDHLERCKLFLGGYTMAAAVWVAFFVAIFVAIFLSVMSGTHWKEAQDKARALRIADAKMNARLLRLNI